MVLRALTWAPLLHGCRAQLDVPALSDIKLASEAIQEELEIGPRMGRRDRGGANRSLWDSRDPHPDLLHTLRIDGAYFRGRRSADGIQACLQLGRR